MNGAKKKVVVHFEGEGRGADTAPKTVTRMEESAISPTMPLIQSSCAQRRMQSSVSSTNPKGNLFNI